MKKLLCLLLCAVCLAGLVACGEPEPVDTQTGTDTVSEVISSDTATQAVTDTDTDTEATTTSRKVIDATSDPEKLRHYNEKLSHLLIITDIKNYSFVVLDPDRASSPEKLTEAAAVVWEWKTQESTSKYKKYMKYGVDDAKLRHSSYYNKDVIIACSSSGWAGIIAYPSGELLLDLRVTGGPHSVELLPNGDFAVACAGTTKVPGSLNYYAVSRGTAVDGAKPDATFAMNGCHGVCWNPDLDRLLIDGYDGIISLKVGGMNGGAVTLTDDGKHSVHFSTPKTCHDMMPVAGTAGKQYYVADGSGLYIYEPEGARFNKATGSFAVAGIKGIASFEDGAVFTTIPGGEGKLTQDWSTCTVRFYRYELTTGKVVESRLKQTAIYFPEREFYKIHNFDINYYL